MAFIEYDKSDIGDWTVTKKIHANFKGYFEIGTKVKIIDITERGYTIEDEYGNMISEIGWTI